MIIEATGFLVDAELRALRGLYSECQTVSGEATAGGEVAQFKHNLELDLGARKAGIKDMILGACNRAGALSYAILPRMVSDPILSLYEPGMFYGSHMDSAIGSEAGRMYRSDISCTLFLDEPSAYDGGELVIESDFGEQTFKLSAGAAIFYSTQFDHQVLPVTRGARRVGVFWIESLIRQADKRRLLFDISQVSEWIAKREPLDSEMRRTVIRTRENLYRMWLET